MYYRRRKGGIFDRYRRKVLFGLMRRESQVEFIEAPQAHIHDDETLDYWEDAFLKNKIELSALLLVYILISNDGKISRTEYRQIKGFMKQNLEHLSERVKLELAGYMTNGLSDERFIDIFTQKKYTLQLFDQAKATIKPFFQNDGKTLLMMERLKEKLSPENSLY